MTSCVVIQAVQGQLPEKPKENTQSVTEQSNDMDTCIGGTSGGNAEKAGPKAGSVQSIHRKPTVLRNRRKKASIYLCKFSV